MASYRKVCTAKNKNDALFQPCSCYIFNHLLPSFPRPRGSALLPLYPAICTLPLAWA